MRITAGVLTPDQFLPSRMDGETIAYWPFGSDGFGDVSGNGHDFEGENVSADGAGYVTLNDGRSDQYLATAEAIDLSKELQVTFECWWKVKDDPAGNVGVLMASQYPESGTGGIVVYNQVKDDNNRIHAQYRVNEPIPGRTGTALWQSDISDERADHFKDGKWHHLAYVVDTVDSTTNSCRLYIDGEEQTSGTQNPILPPLFNDRFFVGGGADYALAGGTNAWHGCIDDVRISRGVLSTDEFLKSRSGSGLLLMFQ